MELTSLLLERTSVAMAKCKYCGAETELYENGVAVCIACDETRHSPKKQPEVDRTPLAVQKPTGSDDRGT